jgi:uncharacterized protein YjbJ (UPF0337 family)
MMGGKNDQMRGRIKEAVGGLTDDDRLKHEGQRDQVRGRWRENWSKQLSKWRRL